jgi:hypothetical protein
MMPQGAPNPQQLNQLANAIPKSALGAPQTPNQVKVGLAYDAQFAKKQADNNAAFMTTYPQQKAALEEAATGLEQTIGDINASKYTTGAGNQWRTAAAGGLAILTGNDEAKISADILSKDASQNVLNLARQSMTSAGGNAGMARAFGTVYAMQMQNAAKGSPDLAAEAWKSVTNGNLALIRKKALAAEYEAKVREEQKRPPTTKELDRFYKVLEANPLVKVDKNNRITFNKDAVPAIRENLGLEPVSDKTEQAQPMHMPEGAKQAADGNWYVPGANGKWLKINMGN